MGLLFPVIQIVIFSVFLAVPLLCLPTQLTLEVLYDRVRNLTENHPSTSSLQEIGRSFENRSIYVVKIHKGFLQKASVVVEFGIHARELASVASGLLFIEKLLTNSACSGLLERITWYVIPVLNPDGYDYAVETAELWRKNRATIPSSSCVGIDLNRNFPVGWENRTGPNYYCRETYCGEDPISEPESLALKNFLDRLTNNASSSSLNAYVAVHTCAPGIFYPYGYKRQKAPNYVELERVGNLMQTAIKKIAGTEYVVAPAYTLGVSGGGVDEWVYDNYHVPLVYTLELDRDYLTHHCFFATALATKRLTHECFASLEALGEYLSPNALTQEERELCYAFDKSYPPRSSVFLIVITPVVCISLLYY